MSDNGGCCAPVSGREQGKLEPQALRDTAEAAACASDLDMVDLPGGKFLMGTDREFLCHKSYCNRYRVAARTQNTPDSSTSHMSFRCASSV